MHSLWPTARKSIISGGVAAFAKSRARSANDDVPGVSQQAAQRDRSNACRRSIFAGHSETIFLEEGRSSSPSKEASSRVTHEGKRPPPQFPKQIHCFSASSELFSDAKGF